MQIAIYARESSDDTSKAPSIQNQISMGKEWIASQGYELYNVFADNGYSGGDWRRPAWNDAVTKAKGHYYNILWVWSQDRIARDTEQFLWFNRNLKESGVKLYSQTDGWIVLDSVGDTAKNISLAMASELFRKVTSEKVKRTYEAKRLESEKKGIKIDWGRKPGNYDIQKIFELRASGKGYRTIARDVGVSYQTIRNVLKNPHNKFVLEKSIIRDVK